MTSSVTYRNKLLPVAAALVVGLTACSNTIAGQPGPPTGVTGSTATTKTTTSKSAAAGPLAGTSPCSLVTEVDRTQLGLKSTPKELTQGHGRKCQFSEGGLTVSLTIFDDLGLDSIQASRQKVTPVPTVGRHKALSAMFGITCSVSIELTGTSMVDVAGNSSDSDQISCDAAMRMAKLVEPKLPGGS